MEIIRMYACAALGTIRRDRWIIKFQKTINKSFCFSSLDYRETIKKLSGCRQERSAIVMSGSAEFTEPSHERCAYRKL